MMSLPEQVMEVGAELEKTNDTRLPIFLKLTVNEDYEEEIEAMWWQIYNQSQTNKENNNWVYSFLDAVIKASNFRKYHYLNKAERNEVINEIKKYTDKLSKIYSQYELDKRLFDYNEHIAGGFSVQEGGDFVGFEEKHKNPTMEDKKFLYSDESLSKASITDVLKVSQDYTVDQLMWAFYQGNKIEEHKVFIKSLAHRNSIFYGDYLMRVLETVTRLLFDKYYSDTREFERAVKNLMKGVNASDRHYYTWGEI